MRRQASGRALALGLALAVAVGVAPRLAGQTAGAQRMDDEYTRRILEQTPDERIKIDLVNHMPLPLDPNVPSPLKVLGYIPANTTSESMTFFVGFLTCSACTKAGGAARSP
jgi:hypothetical protein